MRTTDLDTGEEACFRVPSDDATALAVGFALLESCAKLGLDRSTLVTCGALYAILGLAKPAASRGESSEVSLHLAMPRPFQVSEAPWLELLECLGRLGGRCLGCSSTWSWEHQDQVLSFQALPSETPRQDVSKVLGALELWLLERALKPSELSEFAGNNLIDILEQGAQWEVPETLAERLTATAWWRGCVAQASLPLVVLAVLTVEEPWIWELPWSGQLRLQVAKAVYLMKSCAAQDAGDEAAT